MTEQTTNILDRIAERMTRDALARHGVPVKREFKNEAVVVLKIDAPANGHARATLRIVRKGLSPQNDFSKVGPRRRAAWTKEIDTFRRAFAVPDGIEPTPGTQTVFYFADFVWTMAVAETRGMANGASS